jgi:molybdopterin synthase catalytic subunit
MQVRVLFFGRLKDIVGLADDRAEVSEGAKVEDVFSTYGRRFPELAKFRPSIAPAINQVYSEWSAKVSADDEIAFLPPVSGGSGAEIQPQTEPDICEIVHDPIRTPEILASLKMPADGAVVTFEGIVRNNSKGRETIFLAYEAYEEMALAKMREICTEMRKRFSIDRIAMQHRLGRLEIGETSILIVVTSAHRAAAYDASRFAIDTFKRVVPIWKREHFRDGAIWADGETPPLQPFPPAGESIP